MNAGLVEIPNTKKQRHFYSVSTLIEVWQTIAHGSNPVCHLFLLIIFYWNTARPIRLCTGYGCFYVVIVELSHCNRDNTLQNQKYLLPDPLQRKLANL